MPAWSGLQKFFGKTVSDAASYAAGQAAADTLAPYLQEVTNEAWAQHLSLPVDPASAADIAADDPTLLAWASAEANKSGISDASFEKLHTAALTGPGTGELFSMWRRGKITDALFLHGLRKLKLETSYDTAMQDLRETRLDPSVVANAIVRGLLPAPFPVPFTPDTGGGVIKPYPPSDIDPAREVLDVGMTIDRLALLTAQTGRPLAHQEAAMATFRGIIERADFNLSVAEGDVRTEWADAMFEIAREIPTTTNYVEGYVRNWITHQQMLDGAARHGMSADDAELLFLTHGRPLTHHQVFIGLLRGGTYDGQTDMIDPAFLKSLQESDMRPEWYNLAWFSRYTYPPFFQTASALSKGWITAETATDWMTKSGVEPTAIAAIVAGITQKGTAGGKTLTAAQVKTAWRAGQLTEADALTRLQTDGYSAQDARVYLGVAVTIVPPPTP